VLFSYKKSWRTDSTSHLINHEQIHFYIAELCARKLRKEFKNYIYSASITSQDILQMVANAQKELAVTNEKYDTDTQHSANSIQQAIWAKKIKSELDILGEYDD